MYDRPILNFSFLQNSQIFVLIESIREDLK